MPYIARKDTPKDYVRIGRWDEGAQWEEVVLARNAATITFDLPDGQHIQMTVRPDGTFGLRAWPSIPIVTSNIEGVGVGGSIPSLNEIADGKRPTIDRSNIPSNKLILDCVIKPRDDEWGYADSQARAIASKFVAEQQFVDGL